MTDRVDQGGYARGLSFRFKLHTTIGEVAHVSDEAQVPRHTADEKSKTHTLNHTVYTDMDSLRGTHSSLAVATASHKI